ncbi:hypothetical protein [Liberibacter crescens]|uniref:hypothetical protein n=1 Tax=Liberibacter crescens TaxID=1273132 RepID=UPI0007630841|nr:hypothetical protein [Liberibacter crescens]AMC12683.1 hypothetical protein RL73_02810 [Liberibacter crescens]
MNFIAPWKEIRFRFKSPTFWKINILATLNGMFFAILAVTIAGTLRIIYEDPGTGNLSFPEVPFAISLFFLSYGAIIFGLAAGHAVVLFIPVCLCNLFLNTNRWGTIVYYTLFILLVFSLISFSPSWDLRAAVKIVALSICFGPALGYNIWKHCLKRYTNLTDNKRTELDNIPYREIFCPILNVFKIVLVLIFVVIGVFGHFI